MRNDFSKSIKTIIDWLDRRKRYYMSLFFNRRYIIIRCDRFIDPTNLRSRTITTNPIWAISSHYLSVLAAFLQVGRALTLPACKYKLMHSHSTRPPDSIHPSHIRLSLLFTWLFMLHLPLNSALELTMTEIRILDS